MFLTVSSLWGSVTAFPLSSLFRAFMVSGSWMQLGAVSQVSSCKIWQLTLCVHSSRTYPSCVSHIRILSNLYLLTILPALVWQLSCLQSALNADVNVRDEKEEKNILSARKRRPGLFLVFMPRFLMSRELILGSLYLADCTLCGHFHEQRVIYIYISNSLKEYQSRAVGSPLSYVCGYTKCKAIESSVLCVLCW